MLCKRLPEGRLPFSYGFPLVFPLKPPFYLWCFYYFPKFPWWKCKPPEPPNTTIGHPHSSQDFKSQNPQHQGFFMVFLWFSYDFPWVSPPMASKRVAASAAKTSRRPMTPSPPTSRRPKAMRRRRSGLAVTYGIYGRLKIP